MKSNYRKPYAGLSPTDRTSYHYKRLQATLAAEGCELTIIFHNAKNWDDTTLLAHADLMMGDRLIGEAPEYTLEQWLRCDPLWPHVFDTPAYAHLQSTLDAVQVMPDEENRFNALKAVFHAS